jgi:methyl-accepting chemotaxis protein
VTGHIAKLLIYVFLTAVVLIALASCYFVFQYGKVTKPIITIARAAERIALGDADVEISVNSRDELGVLGDAFTGMAGEMRKQADVISRIATGDYTVSLPVRSEKDLMNKALNGMLETNNKLIANIRVATDQVSAGANQIANGAQGLAEGTTEQAASVAQLSASIAAIADSINEAASSAGNAAGLAAGIRSKAERGSEQMDAMMNAVREINDASQNIGKVIKVIDDIAFQTNILALNAAVEAARAGQHGKGFAVVAEEVRSLAAKSAEAAKNTQKLIENSIEKAELGVKIAEETHSSLQEIVEGIIESSKISGEIAVSADRQSSAIVQINAGIDQVGQVVQQNSATSEESAAASEELSAQAATLNSLIARFKLRDPSGAHLPHTENPPELPGPSDSSVSR